MPSIEMFEKQTPAYKNKVINKDAELVVSIEASNDTKWLKILGKNGVSFGIENYVHSGNGEEVYLKSGFNVKNVVKFVETKFKAQK